MGDNIAADNRDKEMVGLCSIRCPHMNQITLEDTVRSLRENVTEIDVPAELALRAKLSLDRMLAIS
jgi:quinolinate synthase